MYSQDPQGLKAPEGSLRDVADGVVAQAQAVELSQHRQASFIQARQVVVGQIPGGGTQPVADIKETERGGKRSCVKFGRRRLAATGV